MISTPAALGVMLCEKVVIEEQTRYLTVVNTFLRLWEPTFPTSPRGFLVVAILTDGLGDGTMELVATREATGEEIYSGHGPVRFTDRLRELRTRLRVNGVSFPAPGVYRFTLFVDKEWVAHTRLELLPKEGAHGGQTY